MRRPGQVLDRFQLLEHAWDDEYENRSNVVDVYVRYLREKIDRPFGVESIETVRGAGYRLRADGGRLGLQQDLDRAVLLLLERLVGLGRRSSGSRCVAKPSTPSTSSSSSSGMMSSIQRLTLAWPMRRLICLSNIVSSGSGSSMPP